MANYFDNDATTVLIIEYLSFPLEERTINTRALFLREEILKEVSKIVNGIIFTHKFIVWETYDDLYQEASMACLKALDKFNPEYITSNGKKATAFNYFSLTAKRCLKFYTMKNKRNREGLPIEDHINNLTIEDRRNTEDFIKNLIYESRIIVNKKYKKFNTLVDVLEVYLDTMKSYNKRDFFKYAKAFGWSSNLIRKFLKILKENKSEIEDKIELEIKE